MINRNACFAYFNKSWGIPGAGYAGGILSAGVDGIRIAEALALSIAQTEIVKSKRP
jgi:hypothetical protein